MSGYTGRVQVGGAPQVRELPALVVTKVAVGPMDNNCYLLRCRASGEQVLIDAAAEPDLLIDLIGGSGLATIVTTHRHADHVGALVAVAMATGATTAAHPLDAEALPIAPDVLLTDGDVLPVGAVRLTVRHLSGHTPGGLALIYDDPEGHAHVFTGDSLFPGGVGRTQSSQDFAELLNDVEAKVFDLPDETWIYPGHGADTTLGAERPSLGEWRSRGW